MVSLSFLFTDGIQTNEEETKKEIEPTVAEIQKKKKAASSKQASHKDEGAFNTQLFRLFKQI